MTEIFNLAEAQEEDDDEEAGTTPTPSAVRLDSRGHLEDPAVLEEETQDLEGLDQTSNVPVNRGSRDKNGEFPHAQHEHEHEHGISQTSPVDWNDPNEHRVEPENQDRPDVPSIPFGTMMEQTDSEIRESELQVHSPRYEIRMTPRSRVVGSPLRSAGGCPGVRQRENANGDEQNPDTSLENGRNAQTPTRHGHGDRDRDMVMDSVIEDSYDRVGATQASDSLEELPPAPQITQSSASSRDSNESATDDFEVVAYEHEHESLSADGGSKTPRSMAHGYEASFVGISTSTPLRDEPM